MSDEVAQGIIDQALSRESVSVNKKSVVVAITGLMGSGKTTLMNRLFNTWQGGNRRITMSTLSIASYSFRFRRHPWREDNVVTYENITKFPLPLPKRSRTLDHDEFTIINNLWPLPKGESSPFRSSRLSLSTKQVRSTSDPAHKSEVDLVHMIDTGGQPALMELMTSLVHNTNFVVLVHNLTYYLDEHQPVTFRVGGVMYKRHFSSQYTGRQVFLKLASTLRAKSLCRKSVSAFRLMVVATHSDCVEGNLEARVAVLNQELKSLLLPAFKEELILFEAPDNIAFVLNLMCPRYDDKKILEQIRLQIRNPGPGVGEIYREPGSFFAFEQDLVGFATEAGRKILSLEECELVGARLEMNGEMVQAALVLLHCQNTFLYFRHVLPNLVFLKPQALLECINQVVEFSYRIDDGDLGFFSAKFVTLLKDGIITEELLGDWQHSYLFVPGIYEPSHMIKLLHHTFNIAPLSHNVQQSKPPLSEANNEYLMMGLLPAIPAQELHHHIPPPTDTVPLVVKFSSDCVPLSCFSNTICCLLSTFNWKISMQGDGTRECLAHNIAYLRAPGLPVRVVLVDQTQYLEARITASVDIASSASIICSQVRTAIFDAIGKVFEVMQLTEIETSPAVFCPCHTIIKSHLATLATYSNNQHLLVCSQSNSEIQPTEKHLLWFRNEVASQASPCQASSTNAPATQAHPQTSTAVPQQSPPITLSPIITPSQSDKPIMQLLVNFPTQSGENIKIIQRMASEYRYLIINLLSDDDGAITKSIVAENHFQADKITLAVLSRWLQGEGRKPKTWATLITVLHEIELSELAGDIEKNLLNS